MTIQTDHIPTGKLFADLQVTLTEIFLIEMMADATDQRSRLNRYCNVRDAIRGIMRDRFTDDDIADFLENGFPRAVDFGRLT